MRVGHPEVAHTHSRGHGGTVWAQAGRAFTEAERSTATTFVFECADGSHHIAQVIEGEAWLFLASGSVRLVRAEDVSPTRYAAGDTELVIDGDRALLSVDGAGQTTCRNDRQRAVWEHAKLSGVDFRAVGNEPAWVLEMREASRIVLFTDYGTQRIERPLPTPVSDTGGRTTRWDAGDLTVTISADLCHNSMSGEAFESTVIVDWRGRSLRGCGRPLH